MMRKYNVLDEYPDMMCNGVRIPDPDEGKYISAVEVVPLFNKGEIMWVPLPMYTPIGYDPTPRDWAILSQLKYKYYAEAQAQLDQYRGRKKRCEK